MYDLPRLGVGALGDVDFHPGLLNRMQSILVETFDRRDFFSGRISHGRYAGSRRLSVQVDRACPAKPNATPKFRSRQSQNVAQIPEQRHFRLTAERLLNTVRSEEHTSELQS